MRLSELKPGDKATVQAVETTGEVAHRLLDMGLVKGTSFKVIRVAPLGDPIEIKLRGFRLALRIDEARHITVEKSAPKHSQVTTTHQRAGQNG